VDRHTTAEHDLFGRRVNSSKRVPAKHLDLSLDPDLPVAGIYRV
jgi:hypothetical protein